MRQKLEFWINRESCNREFVVSYGLIYVSYVIIIFIFSGTKLVHSITLLFFYI